MLYSNPPRKTFTRREDLTPSIRFYIALTAYMNKGKAWGTIIHLARQYAICRTFVYMLAKTLEESISINFGAINYPVPVVEETLSLKYILSLRLEGRCSLQAISTIMERFNMKNSSVGYISQVLDHIGFMLPDTLSVDSTEAQLVVFLSDEVFSKNTPILVTVEPLSSAILKIELADTRKVEVWKKHWQCLEKNGYRAIYLVCDEGKSLSIAQKETLANIFRQPDTYHAIAHRLGIWADTLERAAYKAIEKEEHCEQIIDSAKSDRVIDKRIKEYELAKKIANEKVETYDNFIFIYRFIIHNLDLFDNNGDLRDRRKSEEAIGTALDLLEELEITKITQEVKKIRNTMPDLFNYFDVAKSVLSDCNKLSMDETALKALCLAHQWQKKTIKAKIAQRRKFCKDKEQFYLEIAQGVLQDDYDFSKNYVYQALDKIVQSSSLVECINSIIRPYLNTSKNQVTQQMLNLIMFYHNHRVYKDGKRKNKTPMEILTGKKQEKDWIDLLFNVLEEKDPSFFTFIN